MKAATDFSLPVTDGSAYTNQEVQGARVYVHAIQSADEMASGVLEDILKPKRAGMG